MKTVNTPYYCGAMTLVETLITVSVFATLMAIGMSASLNSEASQRENYKNETLKVLSEPNQVKKSLVLTLKTQLNCSEIRLPRGFTMCVQPNPFEKFTVFTTEDIFWKGKIVIPKRSVIKIDQETGKASFNLPSGVYKDAWVLVTKTEA